MSYGPSLPPWTHSFTDGWWCIHETTNAIVAKFVREHDALIYIDMANRGVRPQRRDPLRHIAVTVCENCLTRTHPGTCHAAGCLFRNRDLGDVPDLTGAERAPDPPWMAVMSNPLKLGALAAACQNFLDGWDDEQGGTARYGSTVRQLMDILSVPTGRASVSTVNP